MVLIVGTKSIITYTSEPDQFKCYNFDGLVKNLSINLPQLTEASGINSKPGNDDGDDANDSDVNVNGPESFDDTKCKTLQQTGHNSGQSKLPLIVRKIVCGQLSPSEKYLALCDNLKQLFVVTTDDWKVCNVFNVERKCDHLLFNQSEDQLIVTNRSGWVYGYFLDANNKNRENFLLGHNSIVLDIKLSPCSKYLATCDRDEKIRISNYPNCYNIQSYCLGHTQFVSCLTFLDDSTLISGGGDGTLRVWDYQNGKQLAVHHCNQELNCANDKLAPRAIHSFSNHKLLIVVTFYNSPNIEIYQITDGSIKSLKKQSILSLEADIIDSYVINGCQLICFTNNSERFVVSFNLSSSEAVLNGDDSVTLIENLSPLMSSILNDKELIKNFISEKLTVNSIGWLYKHVYDNVNEYLERKKERQENKMTKKIKSS